MKTNLSFILCILAIVSCSKETLVQDNTMQNKVDTGIYRSIEEIRDIAASAPNLFLLNTQTKSTAAALKIKDVLPVHYCQTKSMQDTPLMYVVNYSNNAGFSLIGAQKGSPEILAYIENGYYNGGISDNPGFNMFIETITDRIKKNPMMKKRGDFDTSHIETETSTSTTGVDRLINVAWHQRLPFNRYCSIPFNYNIPAGCVAVAIAQIMSFHSYPLNINLTYPGANINCTVLDWNNMIKSEHSYHHDFDCIVCQQNGNLLREIGQRVNMNYSEKGSSAFSGLAKNAFESLGYSTSNYKQYSFYETLSDIDNRKPVFIRAENNSSGHAWVVDGHKYTKTDKYHYRVDGYEQTLIAKESFHRWYLHFNYGWGSSFIGYYLAKGIDEGKGEIIVGGEYYDTPISIFTGERNLNKNIHIISNITPNR
ncbi:MAG: C10 family peptidase [Candidatus Cryptobacteroides sp.]